MLIFISLVDYNNSNLDIFNCNFSNNYGSIEGGVLKITGMIVHSKNSTYFNNSSPYGKNIAAYPVKISLDQYLSNISELSQKEPYSYVIGGQVTGSPIEQPVYLKVVDFFNQTITTIVNQIGQISVKEFNKTDINVKDFSFVGKESVIIENGTFYYDNATLYSDPPDSVLTLAFSTNQIPYDYLVSNKSAAEMNLEEIQEEMRPQLGISTGDINISNSYFYLIDVKMRNCIEGEIYNPVSKSCTTCPYKTYSFNPNDTSCTDCPQNAVCLGGTNLMVNPGFWKSSNLSVDIHACSPFAPSCL